MKKKIKFYRVLLNILFYVFYVLLISILFSFIFPLIMVMLGKEVLDPSNPVFSNIQILIFIVVFIFSVSLRKFLYLPIFVDRENVVEKVVAKETEKNQEQVKSVEPEITEEVVFNANKQETNINKKLDEEIKDENTIPELDIKIGRELK